MIFTFRRSNSGWILAMYPSSVVHTGVKSFGCENSTAHESPIHSWNRIVPCVVRASKSGAVSPIASVIVRPPLGKPATAILRPPPARIKLDIHLTILSGATGGGATARGPGMCLFQGRIVERGRLPTRRACLSSWGRKLDDPDRGSELIEPSPRPFWGVGAPQPNTVQPEAGDSPGSPRAIVPAFLAFHLL